MQNKLAITSVLNITLILVLGLACKRSFAVELAALDGERIYQKWEQIPAQFEGTWDTVNVHDYGIIPQNTTDNAAKLQQIIDAHDGNTVFYFPAGEYQLEAQIQILLNRVRNDHVVIQGAGPTQTKLLFTGDVPYFSGLITVEDKASFGDRNNPVALASTPSIKDTVIHLEQAHSKIIPGRILCIKQDNDTALVYPPADSNRAWYIKWKNGEADWADESMGQFVRVKAVQGTRVVLDKPLGFDFNQAMNPRVSVYDSFGSKVGVQDLYIEHIIPDNRYTPGGINDVFTIVFRFAQDCYVKNVHSKNAARGHVMAEYTYNVAIVNNVFERARRYGVGGAGYGVAVQNRSSNTYIANNVFDHLRHSVVLKEGANYTVIAYNHSKNWALLNPEVVDEDGNRIFAEADMSVHGFYSHNNLFEGNVCHNIFLADYWGPTGPGTTVFRNYTTGIDTLSGIWVDDFSHHQNVIGNEMPGASQLIVTGGSEDVLVEGNVLGNSVLWNSLPATSMLPPSLYLDQAPDFWDGQLQWPPFGPDVSNNELQRIPSQKPDSAENELTISPAHSNPKPQFNSIKQQYDLLGREW
jgi:hypothetical protein